MSPLSFRRKGGRVGGRRAALAAVAWVLGACAVAGLPAARAADSVSIAAAADLVYCLDELDAAFLRVHPGVDLKVSSGSSGNFATQIRNGAPFDVFLSADLEYPRDLVKAGLADGKSLTPYAVGRLVFWTAKPEKVDVSRGLALLAQPEPVSKLAVANPDHAPYGRAAKEALEHEKLWELVQPRIVLGENISQTAQFVATGNADAGLVALSLVLSPQLAKVGKWQEIPTEWYGRLEQGGVLTSAGAKNPLARAYLEFLRTPEARKILDRYGFRM
jgi:molybdate transport system substrate-binding protein